MNDTKYHHVDDLLVTFGCFFLRSPGCCFFETLPVSIPNFIIIDLNNKNFVTFVSKNLKSPNKVLSWKALQTQMPKDLKKCNVVNLFPVWKIIRALQFLKFYKHLVYVILFRSCFTIWRLFQRKWDEPVINSPGLLQCIVGIRRMVSYTSGGAFSN